MSSPFGVRFGNQLLSIFIPMIMNKVVSLITDQGRADAEYLLLVNNNIKTRKAFNDANAAVNKLYELPSRKAITSGMLNEVPDKTHFTYLTH